MHAQIEVLIMKELKQFDIPFTGLKEGEHQFEYDITQEFFEFFKYDEVQDSNVRVTITLIKKATVLELLFICKGWVTVACDVINEPYKQPISTNLNLVVKFGEEYNNENEEILIIPHNEFKINVSQYIYEAIVLAIPLKKEHPGIANGTIKSEILEKLEELKINSKKNKQETDPRWDKLKDILK